MVEEDSVQRTGAREMPLGTVVVLRDYRESRGESWG